MKHIAFLSLIALNPQPEPPGVMLNPQPEPPGVLPPLLGLNRGKNSSME